MQESLLSIFTGRVALDTLEALKANQRAIVGINFSSILMAIRERVPPLFSAVVHNLSTVGVALPALRPREHKRK